MRRIEPLASQGAHAVGTLEKFASALFEAGGMDSDKAEATARLLVRADALGHSTHGLAQAPAYLAELENGGMNGKGDFEIVKEAGACMLIDGKRLPGPWLAEKAIALTVRKARSLGTALCAVRHSHHIGALAVLLEPVVESGLLIRICASDPAAATVAPAGAVEAVLSTNPIAFGMPTADGPVLMDFSTAATNAAAVSLRHRAGTRFAHEALVHRNGTTTTEALTELAILPLGGSAQGYKGTALALMVEAMTSGLAGAGRIEQPKAWGANLSIEIVDPDFLAGADRLRLEMTHTTRALRAAKPASTQGVRLPGDQGLRLAQKAQREGIVLSDAIREDLNAWARRLGLASTSCPAGES